MGVQKEKSFRVQYPYAQAFDIARAALMGIGAAVQQYDASSGGIVATTGTSMQSYGEIIGVQIRPNGSDQCDIRVTSTSAVPTTMFDWGKNQQNLNAFEAMFAQVAMQSQGGTALPTVASDNDDDLFSDLYYDDVEEEPTSPMFGIAEAIPRSRPTDAQTHKVFISYRRSDSIDICGRIYDRLVRDFGEQNVFKDVDNIPFGVDFVEYLDSQVKECTVLFAVIGPKWTNAQDDKGRQRLADPNDFVRIEIESALRRNILVVPLLVGGAAMPHVEDLPESLQPLTRRNGIEVRPDPDFHNDMTRLIKRLG